MASAIDLSNHKRTLIIEGLNAKSTKASLTKYLSEYQIKSIRGPFLDKDTTKYRAHVMFNAESSVDSLLSERPHQIDDEDVEIYRSIPDEESGIAKQGTRNLIVFGIKSHSLTKIDLHKHFGSIGEIKHIDMKYEEDYSCIEFNDYDSVDQAMLNVPCVIRKVEVKITKGERTTEVNRQTSSKSQQIASDDNTSCTSKPPNPRQTGIRPQPVKIKVENRKYFIHITNLSLNANADNLSRVLDWSIYNIIMCYSSNNQSTRIECWLKDVDNLKAGEDFVREWKGKTVLGSKIECQLGEDKINFCRKFRLGECEMSGDVCRWVHMMCTDKGKCPPDCPYGHPKGAKTGPHKSEPGEKYQLKITGFQENMTQQSLAKLLHQREDLVCVNPNKQQIGYIIKIKTFNFAKDLMEKLHNKSRGVHHSLQCQIELHSNGADKKNNRRYRSGSRQRSDRAAEIRSNPLVSSDEEKHDITKANGPKFIDDDHTTNNNVPGRYKKVVHERTEDIRQVTMIRRKDNHDSVALLTEYQTTDRKIYLRELNALQILKGVNGVAQLLDSDDTSNNGHQRFSSNGDFWIITEHVSGSSLKEFVSGIHRGGFTLLEAIQLSQNLITIIKSIHSRGVLHQNLEPENITIEWDSKKTSIDQAQLTVTNFSQSCLKSDKSYQTTTKCWYKAPQSDVESSEYSSTIDASSICAILLWLLTNIDPQNDRDLLPHERQNVEDKINRKIAEEIRTTNSNRKHPDKQTQLKTYLIDTFSIAFGYPQRQPWSIGDLECRLESIHELVSPRNPKMDSTDAIFQDLLSTRHITTSIPPDNQQDIFQKASNAFYQAKRRFSEMNQNQYSWSDGSCIWSDSTQTSMNERRHDDILTYYSGDRRTLSGFSVIITSFATLSADGNIMTLSIGSTTNGRTSRIPIGRYVESEDYLVEFKKDFTSELNNLIISICKERKAQ